MNDLISSDRPPADAGIFGLDFSLQDAKLVLVPVPWDATTSYGQGTAEGPETIFGESHQLDLEDPVFGPAYLKGVHWFSESLGIEALNVQALEAIAKVRLEQDAGNPKPEALTLVNRLGEQVHKRVEETAAELLKQGKVVGLVGGEHSVAFGGIQAVSRKHSNFGILHFDAHHDLRVAYEGVVHSHASALYNVLEQTPAVSKLVSVGIRDYCREEADYARESDRVVTFYDHELHNRLFAGESWQAIARDIIGNLPEKVYVSFDIDGLDPVCCPGTGTPVPGGLSFRQSTFLIEELHRSGRKLIGFDLNEVGPGLNRAWNGNVGARILYKLSLAALSSL